MGHTPPPYLPGERSEGSQNGNARPAKRADLRRLVILPWLWVEPVWYKGGSEGRFGICKPEAPSPIECRQAAGSWKPDPTRIHPGSQRRRAEYPPTLLRRRWEWGEKTPEVKPGKMRLGFGVLFQHHGQRPPLPLGTHLSCIRGCSQQSLLAALHPPPSTPASKHQAWAGCGWEPGRLGILLDVGLREAVCTPCKGEGPLLTPAKGKELQLGRTLPMGEPSWRIEDLRGEGG